MRRHCSAGSGAARRMAAMSGQSRILVVEDEGFLADLVATALSYAGFGTRIATTGGQALRAMDEDRPDLVLLDIGLPDMDGIDLCTRLRARRIDVPVIFLTARDATEDKISGLRVGDDYLTKPFAVAELVARVQAVLRRSTPGPATGVIRVADLEIDREAHLVRRAGARIDLTPTEFALLHVLAANAGKVLTKDRIHEYVWGFDARGSDANVQTFISYLRRKVDAHGPSLIHTVPRVGYVLREDTGRTT